MALPQLVQDASVAEILSEASKLKSKKDKVEFLSQYKNRKDMYKSTYYLISMIFIQLNLGIFTLQSGAYIWIASLHQISTIFLLISSIYFYYNSLKA